MLPRNGSFFEPSMFFVDYFSFCCVDFITLLIGFWVCLLEDTLKSGISSSYTFLLPMLAIFLAIASLVIFFTALIGSNPAIIISFSVMFLSFSLVNFDSLMSSSSSSVPEFSLNCRFISFLICNSLSSSFFGLLAVDSTAVDNTA